MHLERLSLNDAAQVAAVTALETAMWDWCPWRPEDFVHSIRAFPQDKLMEWYVLLEDGEVSGYGSVLETFWLATPGQAQFGAGAQNFDVDHYRFIVEANLARLRELGFSRFMTSIPSKQSGYCHALEDLGFTLNMRQKVSRLDITDIDLSVVPPRDWDLVSFSEYEARNPETFRHDLWQLIQEVLRDVPMPEPFVTEPFDDWAREYFKPDLDLDARVLAVKEGKLIGLSEIAPNKVEPAKASRASPASCDPTEGRGSLGS